MELLIIAIITVTAVYIFSFITGGSKIATIEELDDNKDIIDYLENKFSKKYPEKKIELYLPENPKGSFDERCWCLYFIEGVIVDDYVLKHKLILNEKDYKKFDTFVTYTEHKNAFGENFYPVGDKDTITNVKTYHDNGILANDKEYHKSKLLSEKCFDKEGIEIECLNKKQ
tara:strand:+ start:408 stop:920 length:513 start_codon:yes stop_codon:yes gene_type:complete